MNANFSVNFMIYTILVATLLVFFAWPILLSWEDKRVAKLRKAMREEEERNAGRSGDPSRVPEP